MGSTREINPGMCAMPRRERRLEARGSLALTTAAENTPRPPFLEPPLVAPSLAIQCRWPLYLIAGVRGKDWRLVPRRGERARRAAGMRVQPRVRRATRGAPWRNTAPLRGASTVRERPPLRPPSRPRGARARTSTRGGATHLMEKRETSAASWSGSWTRLPPPRRASRHTAPAGASRMPLGCLEFAARK